MKKRSGFSLVDLMVVVVLLLFLAAVIVPAVYQQSWGNSDKINCARNLRQIGLAMKMYANDETRTNAYPRTIYKPDAPLTQFTSPNSPHPFAGPMPPGPNDVTAAPFLLLRTQDITSDVFVCPATNFLPFPGMSSVQQFSNFTATSQLGYSFQNPYPTAAAVSNGFQFNDSMSADFAIVADINPGTPELTTTPMNSASSKMNSPNHGKDGQNVLYADGHVEWQTTTFVGTQMDNIYVFGPSPVTTHRAQMNMPIGIVGSPINSNDSILLPTFDTSLPSPSGGGALGLLAIGVGVLIILGGIGALLYFLLKKPNTPNTPSSPPPLPMGA